MSLDCHRAAMSLDCHRGAMMMFDKLCRKWWSSCAHRTETVTTMGHERSVAASYIRSDQKQQSFVFRISSWNKVLQGRHLLQIRGDFDVQTWTHRCTSQSDNLAQPDVDIRISAKQTCNGSLSSLKTATTDSMSECVGS